jgi:hypothetical protein
MREVAWPLSAESLPRELRFVVKGEPRAAVEPALPVAPNIATGGAAAPAELKVGLASVSSASDLALTRDPALSRVILIVPPRSATQATADNSAELQPTNADASGAKAPVTRRSNVPSSSNESFTSPAQTKEARAAAEIAAASDVSKQLEPIAELPQPSRDRQLVNATEPPRPSPAKKAVPFTGPSARVSGTVPPSGSNETTGGPSSDGFCYPPNHFAWPGR